MKKKSNHVPSANAQVSTRYFGKMFQLTTLCLLLTSVIPVSCKKNLENNEKAGAAPGKIKVASVSSSNIWYNKFVAYDNEHGNDTYNSTSSAVLAWDESVLLRSYVIMWELTKDTAWLTKLTTHVDAMIAHTTDLGGDGYLDWGTTKYGDGGNYPYLVHDGMICLPIAQFIRLVHIYPTTLAAFATKATAYRTFIENEIVPKWEDPSSYMGNCWTTYSSSTGYYKESTKFNAFPNNNFSQLPYNQMAPYAEMLWAMYAVNGDSFYNLRANQMAQFFKNGLMANGTAYKWKYCTVVANVIEDTSHGNLEVGMAINSFNRGGTFEGDVIPKVSSAFTTKMWNQSMTAPIVNDRVDGGSTTHNYTKFVADWVRLTQFNWHSWTIAAEQFRNYTPTGHNNAYTLAQIMNWDPEKLINHGFEYKTYDDLTLPAQWARGNGTSTQVRITTAQHAEGYASAEITSSVDGIWQNMNQDWKYWKPNTTYEVSFDIKTSGSNGARIFIQNVTTGINLSTVNDYPSSPSWSHQSFTVTTPAATGPVLRIYLENNLLSGAGTAWFDNVIIKQVGDAW